MSKKRRLKYTASEGECGALKENSKLSKKQKDTKRAGEKEIGIRSFVSLR